MLINEIQQNNTEEIRKILTVNCSESIAACYDSDNFLFHGSGFDDSFVMNKDYLVDITRNRIPRQHEDIAEIIDDKLKLSGFKALRSNSLFCIGDYTEATHFSKSNIYVIFPFDGFNLTWSTESKYYFGIDPGYFSEYSNDELDAIPPKEFISKFGLRNYSLSSAISSGHEVLIQGKFLAVSWTITNSNFLRQFVRGV